ncbi:MAG: zinc-ribbon and DUF3426 domain-containing protein [Gallionellaceae bacterium]|nr:zinc-ribbon and DUF3426 domain-containing protein [Gallionellaceae bacterium]
MNTITQCPQCGTRFKVIQDQLETHQGMVRCGRCQSVFNAKQYMENDEPSPQLSLPIMPQGMEIPLAITLPDSQPAVVAPAPPAAPLPLAQQFSTLSISDEIPGDPIKKSPLWLLLGGGFIFIVILLAQATYFFRVELAARLPGLKPVLMSYCAVLKCSVPLPQKAEQLSIESSNLEASPEQVNTIALNAILRNLAPYAQAYPNLELTLTDTSERALARRTFLPKDYLTPGEDEKQGLSPNREINIKLHLDITDLRPTGYRLFLLYPQSP